ncbi:MAG: hypothetical protein M3067_05735 [Chloroflexota bacterium]|nr:hypothetical protein [Chloroflexota bacterium]
MSPPASRFEDPTCAVTPFETIPPNDVVAWQSAEWQRAAAGVWAHPYFDSYDPGNSGFRGSDPGVKILWWVEAPGDLAIVLGVDSLSGTYKDGVKVDSPGALRHDRPTGFSMPPPGCYRISITLGRTQGSIIDRVLR